MLAKLRRWLLSDGFLSFGLRIATIGAMLVNNVLVARLLPDRNAVGHYFELWGIVYFFAVIGHLGLRTSVVQWVAQGVHRQDVDEVGASIRAAIGIAQLSYGILSVGVGLTLFFLPRYQTEEVVWLSLLVVLWLFSLGIQYSMSEIFRGFEHHLWAGTLGGALTQILLLGFLVLIWCLKIEPTIMHVVAATVVASMCNFGLLIAMLYRIRKRYPTDRRLPWSNALRQSLPMLMTSLASATLTFVDVIVLSWFVSADRVAIYAASCRVAALVSISNQISISILTPKIAKAIADHDPWKIRSAMKSSLAPVGIVTVLVFACYLFAGSMILKLVFGEGYEAGWSTLLLVSLTHGISVFAGRTGVLLMLSGHQTTAMRINILGAVFAVFFQAAGAYGFGAVGVAIGTMFGYIVLVTLQAFATQTMMRGMTQQLEAQPPEGTAAPSPTPGAAAGWPGRTP